MYSVLNKRVVVTGRVPGYDRPAAQRRLEVEAGALVSKGGISSRTQVLVVGLNVSSRKIQDASRRGIDVVRWADVDFTAVSTRAAAGQPAPVADAARAARVRAAKPVVDLLAPNWKIEGG